MWNNLFQKKIRETRKRMDELDERSIRMVEERERPVYIHAVRKAYLRERKKLEAYEYCATH